MEKVKKRKSYGNSANVKGKFRWKTMSHIGGCYVDIAKVYSEDWKYWLGIGRDLL